MYNTRLKIELIFDEEKAWSQQVSVSSKCTMSVRTEL